MWYQTLAWLNLRCQTLLPFCIKGCTPTWFIESQVKGSLVWTPTTETMLVGAVSRRATHIVSTQIYLSLLFPKTNITLLPWMFPLCPQNCRHTDDDAWHWQICQASRKMQMPSLLLLYSISSLSVASLCCRCRRIICCCQHSDCDVHYITMGPCHHIHKSKLSLHVLWHACRKANQILPNLQKIH